MLYGKSITVPQLGFIGEHVEIKCWFENNTIHYECLFPLDIIINYKYDPNVQGSVAAYIVACKYSGYYSKYSSKQGWTHQLPSGMTVELNRNILYYYLNGQRIHSQPLPPEKKVFDVFYCNDSINVHGVQWFYSFYEIQNIIPTPTKYEYYYLGNEGPTSLPFNTIINDNLFPSVKRKEGKNELEETITWNELEETITWNGEIVLSDITEFKLNQIKVHYQITPDYVFTDNEFQSQGSYTDSTHNFTIPSQQRLYIMAYQTQYISKDSETIVSINEEIFHTHPILVYSNDSNNSVDINLTSILNNNLYQLQHAYKFTANLSVDDSDESILLRFGQGNNSLLYKSFSFQKSPYSVLKNKSDSTRVFKIDSGYERLKYDVNIEKLTSSDSFQDKKFEMQQSKILPAYCVINIGGVNKLFIQDKDRNALNPKKTYKLNENNELEEVDLGLEFVKVSDTKYIPVIRPFDGEQGNIDKEGYPSLYDGKDSKFWWTKHLWNVSGEINWDKTPIIESTKLKKLCQTQI